MYVDTYTISGLFHMQITETIVWMELVCLERMTSTIAYHCQLFQFMDSAKGVDSDKNVRLLGPW